MADEDPTFDSLPPSIQRKIDEAFAKTIAGERDFSSYSPRKRRRLVAEVQEPGGFLLDQAAPGGFIIDGEEDSASRAESDGFTQDMANKVQKDIAIDGTDDSITSTRIPLSLIPSALQLLDLPSDDEEILDVFRKAAAGWSEDHTNFDENPDNDANFADDSGKWVSRKDWRAVCAALLEGDQDTEVVEDWNQSEAQIQDQQLRRKNERQRNVSVDDPYLQAGGFLIEDKDVREKSDTDEDDYDNDVEMHRESFDDDDLSDLVHDDSQDEYVEEIASSSKVKLAAQRKGPAAGTRTAKTRQAEVNSSLVDDSENEDEDTEEDESFQVKERRRKGKGRDRRLGTTISRPRELTASEKRQCRAAYSLFFPDVPDEDLDRKIIMISDITRVAGLLKEKIRAEEIVEMLEMFSSSPDKSVNLENFERIMVDAKLI